MNALLVGGAPVIGTELLVAGLAADAEMVIAVDSGAALCLAAGIEPDLAVGDFDSLAPASLASLRGLRTRIVAVSADKDVTDLDLAFAVARDHCATRTVVTAVTGGRVDHSLAVLGTLLQNTDLFPRIVESDLIAEVLESERTLCVCGDGATFSVVALRAPACVTVEGARWPLHRATLEPLSSHGVSNVVVGHARITVHDGKVVVLAPTIEGLSADLKNDHTSCVTRYNPQGAVRAEEQES